MKHLAIAAAALLGLSAGSHAQTLAAVDAAERALMVANDTTPLTVGYSALVTVKAPAFGAYTGRASNHYKPGETVLFYVEPVGLKHKPVDGVFTAGLSMDLLVKRGGLIVFGKEEFIKADFPSHHPLREIMLNGDLTINAPADSYEIELVLHDHNSSEVARTTLPFVIDGDAGAPTAK